MSLKGRNRPMQALFQAIAISPCFSMTSLCVCPGGMHPIHHFFGIIQIAILSLVGKGVCLSQTESYFEGVVYSKCIAVDARGKELPFPWDKSVEYYDKHRIIIRITEDIQSESSDVCLDSEKRGLYKINHDYSTVTRLADREARDIPVLEFKKIGEEKLLGYKCDVYFLKYIDSLTKKRLYNLIFTKSYNRY